MAAYWGCAGTEGYVGLVGWAVCLTAGCEEGYVGLVGWAVCLMAGCCAEPTTGFALNVILSGACAYWKLDALSLGVAVYANCCPAAGVVVYWTLPGCAYW